MILQVIPPNFAFIQYIVAVAMKNVVQMNFIQIKEQKIVIIITFRQVLPGNKEK